MIISEHHEMCKKQAIKIKSNDIFAPHTSNMIN